MALICPQPFLQFEDGNGNPLSGGLLYTYAAGTTTPLATYTDSGGGTPNANPVVLDSNGIASVWLSSALYYFELKTSAGVLVKTVDNVGGALTSAGSSSFSVTTLTVSGASSLQGLTAGLGAGSIGTNTAYGVSALAANTTGSNITGIGYHVLQANTTGVSNTAAGSGALAANTTGSYNNAVGVNALTVSTTGQFNNALGHTALFSNTTGSYNTALGQQALYLNTTASSNTAVGALCLSSNTTGAGSVALGSGALFNGTTGNYNTALGFDSLQALTTTANSTGVGANTAVTGANQVQLGDAATTTYAYGAVQNRSDARDKADIRDTKLGLSFIAALRPVDYRWDMREFYKPSFPVDAAKRSAWLEDVKLDNVKTDGSKKRSRFHHGFIAQEVQEVIKATGIDFGGFQDHKLAGGQDVLSLGYEELIAPMVKAIQELKAEVDALKAAQ